jgi:lysophospholipase L1-like esterase
MNHAPAVVLAALLPLALSQPKDTAPPPAKHEQTAQPDEKKKEEKPANPAVVPVPRAEEGCKQRHERFNERAKQGHEKGDIDLIFMGDSITEGWENAGKEAWAKHYGERHAVNCGIGGDETEHLLWRIQNGNLDGLDKPEPKDAKPPHLAVIMIGTNNLGNTRHFPEQTAEGVETVVKALREKLPHTQVLLLAIFPRGEKADDPLRQQVVKTNALIKPRLESLKGVHYLDIGEKFMQKDGTISRDIMPDLLHLSPQGYEVWAQAIEAKVHELLGEK